MSLPSIVNTIPRGLLDLLGLKTTGRNPSSLADEVRPSADLVAFYLAAKRVSMMGPTIALGLAPGLTALSVVVPQNEIWWVESCHGFCSQASGGITSSIQIGWLTQAGLPGPLAYLSPFQPPTAATELVRYVVIPGSYFVLPGYQLHVSQNGTQATAINVRGEVTYTPLSI